MLWLSCPWIIVSLSTTSRRIQQSRGYYRWPQHKQVGSRVHALATLSPKKMPSICTKPVTYPLKTECHIIHALIHDLLHRYFLYCYTNPCINFTCLVAAIRFCYVVQYAWCSAISSTSSNRTQNTVNVQLLGLPLFSFTYWQVSPNLSFHHEVISTTVLWKFEHEKHLNSVPCLAICGQFHSTPFHRK